MAESSPNIYPLPYAEPSTRPPRPTRFVVLTVVNALAAGASLWFVPLAIHIFGCTEDKKWCHVQAIVLGVPSALVWLGLLTATAFVKPGVQSAARRSKPLKIAAWLLLSFAGLVLLALFGAVAQN